MGLGLGLALCWFVLCIVTYVGLVPVAVLFLVLGLIFWCVGCYLIAGCSEFLVVLVVLVVLFFLFCVICRLWWFGSACWFACYRFLAGGFAHLAVVASVGLIAGAWISVFVVCRLVHCAFLFCFLFGLVVALVLIWFLADALFGLVWRVWFLLWVYCVGFCGG